jgi:hypothetical protein
MLLSVTSFLQAVLDHTTVVSTPLVKRSLSLQNAMAL